VRSEGSPCEGKGYTEKTKGRVGEKKGYKKEDRKNVNQEGSAIVTGTGRRSARGARRTAREASSWWHKKVIGRGNFQRWGGGGFGVDRL